MTRRCAHHWAALLALVCFSSRAEISADTVLSLRADAWSGDRELSQRTSVAGASVWGRSQLDAGSAGQVVASARLGATSSAGARHGRWRELYWRHQLGPVRLKLGRQAIVWGRADGLNPTDHLSPRDHRLLAPEDGDLRHGNEAAHLETRTPGDGLLALVWFPNAASHEIPLRAVPGVSYRTDPARGRQWAAKWDFNRMPADGGSSVDGSVSYFHGLDLMPDLTPGAFTSTGVEVILRNQRLRVLGADLSLTDGPVVWRAEAALTRTASRGAADFEHKKPQFWVVGGGEWTRPGGITLGLQATALHVFHHGDPDRLASGPQRELAWRQLATSGQTARDQIGLVWRVAQRRWNDSLSLETSGVALWDPNGGGSAQGIARVRAGLELPYQWQLQVGADRYFGDKGGTFGQLRDNSLAYVQLRYGI